MHQGDIDFILCPFHYHVDYFDKDPDDVYQDNVDSRYIDLKIEEHFLDLDEEKIHYIYRNDIHQEIG